MPYCFIFLAKKIAYKLLKAFFQVLCNLIPNQKARIKARRYLYDKHLHPKFERYILHTQQDSFVPKAVLAKINAYENEYFIEQNAKIALNAMPTNERERERE
ncbi:hypothetical protein [Campylobacter troglodytis]|uniref:hypothetical protein n=1 Tax=Campylobacter troglodytis TaxID=654363 RepID=UPI00115B88F5|nr:hypothetical protein [Campylobacter troglodytis]TQR53854.1 hypothetical protein DMC01_10780 [Campylobacter troglodytis]